MKFQGQAVLVYLEEDNITKAYFRIRPLLTNEGPVPQEELDSFPDEGYLRIVPDKNEQHTFKERMRHMCGLCLLDLRNQPAEANKIRTNKNYNPSKGEVNQFIVYSDAVQAIPDNLLYQVVSQADAQKAVTPKVYVRNGANMQGPMAKDQPDTAGEQLLPDSKGLYSVSVNGQELLFYWPESKSVPAQDTSEPPVAAPEEPVTALDKIQQMNASCVSESTHKLKEEKAEPAFVPQQQPQHLTGTRLYQPPQKQANFRRAHNALMETVEQQRYAAKYEAPGAVVCDCSALKDVENPVDAFKRTLSEVCHNEESCRQAVGALLSCPGMRQAIVSAVSDTKRDLTVTAMHGQLQELEAERLMLLMQLDDAKKNAAAFRQEAIGELQKDEKAAIDALKVEKNALSDEIQQQQAVLSSLQSAMSEGEDALKNCLTASDDVLITRRVGSFANKEALTRNLEAAIKAAGFICEPGDALAILTAYAIESSAVFFNSQTHSDAMYAADVFAAAFGTSVYNSHNPHMLIAPGGNTPVFIRGAANQVCTSVSTVFDPVFGPFNMSYTDKPMFTLWQNTESMPGALPSFPAVSAASMEAAFVKEDKLSDDTLAVLSSLRHIQNVVVPLKALRNAMRFIASTQNSFSGGLAESIDRAVSVFILPCFMNSNVSTDELLLHIAAMPRSMKIWNQKK